MSNEIMQENTPFVECSAFHRGMSVLEANLRNTEDSEAIISGLLKGAAEFYGASKECTNYFKCNFHPLHQATASLNCFHVISLQKRHDHRFQQSRFRQSLYVPDRRFCKDITWKQFKEAVAWCNG